MKFLLLLIFSAVAWGVIDDKNASPFLLAHRTSVSKKMKAGEDHVIRYFISNQGEKTAHNVVLKDSYSFVDEKFNLVNGSRDAKWGKLEPGMNVTHDIVVRPNENTKGPIDNVPFEVQYTYNGKTHICLPSFDNIGFVERASRSVKPYWIVFGVSNVIIFGILKRIHYSLTVRYC
ncbi:hypothetical protein QR680_016751 [Steinernema hermaphroditum]|uniref:Translocon-associated protein subunit beta n=1 Tax=Steinernema hermaphroditum TaxID=289476 RepID=A0AA39LMG0_9BILA|nr:hypothetical protein QR680_016751 [Steinernema hermaphroditum]